LLCGSSAPLQHLHNELYVPSLALLQAITEDIFDGNDAIGHRFNDSMFRYSEELE
jgi:hypothetical protein